MRRVLNEAIAVAAEGLDAGEGLPFEFFCECSDLSCKRLVELSVAGYRDRSQSGAVLADGAGCVSPMSASRRSSAA